MCRAREHRLELGTPIQNSKWHGKAPTQAFHFRRLRDQMAEKQERCSERSSAPRPWCALTLISTAPPRDAFARLGTGIKAPAHRAQRRRNSSLATAFMAARRREEKRREEKEVVAEESGVLMESSFGDFLIGGRTVPPELILILWLFKALQREWK